MLPESTCGKTILPSFPILTAFIQSLRVKSGKLMLPGVAILWVKLSCNCNFTHKFCRFGKTMLPERIIVNSRVMFTTHSRVMFTRHSRPYVYQWKGVAGGSKFRGKICYLRIRLLDKKNRIAPRLYYFL